MTRTRFAPSPTGSLHLGSALSAVANRRRGDWFLLRIDDTDRARLSRLAPRFLDAADHAAERFAAMEAALKALGRGLLDGGVFDRGCPVAISLDPPRITIADDELALVLGRLGDSIVAIAYAPSSVVVAN